MLTLGHESEPSFHSSLDKDEESEEWSGSDFETDEEIYDFVDPRKEVDCWDKPYIDCIY